MNNILSFASNMPFATNTLNIDSGKGVLSNVRIVQTGEAKGHGLHLEQEFVDKLVTLGNSKRDGIKIKFDHPTYGQTNINKFLGRALKFKVVGNFATAELKLSKIAKNLPGLGNAYKYILAMAKENPDLFGISIEFQYGMRYQKDDKGGKIYRYIKNEAGEIRWNPAWSYRTKTYATIEDLTAVAFVLDPAATASLFENKKNMDHTNQDFQDFKKFQEQEAQRTETAPVAIDVDEKGLFEKFKAFWKFSKNEEEPKEVANKELTELKSQFESFKQNQTKTEGEFNKKISDLEAELAAKDAELLKFQKEPAAEHTTAGGGDAAPEVDVKPPKTVEYNSILETPDEQLSAIDLEMKKLVLSQQKAVKSGGKSTEDLFKAFLSQFGDQSVETNPPVSTAPVVKLPFK